MLTSLRLNRDALPNQHGAGMAVWLYAQTREQYFVRVQDMERFALSPIFTQIGRIIRVNLMHG